MINAKVIVSGYGLDGLGSFPGSGVHPTAYLMNAGNSFSGNRLKRMARGGKNTWSFTSTPIYYFMS
jgi:hypothetical protein